MESGDVLFLVGRIQSEFRELMLAHTLAGSFFGVSFDTWLVQSLVLGDLHVHSLA